MPARKKSSTTKKSIKSSAKSKVEPKVQADSSLESPEASTAPPIKPQPPSADERPPVETAASKLSAEPSTPNRHVSPAATDLPADAPRPRSLPDRSQVPVELAASIEPPKPLPLVKTTYNQAQIKRSAVLMLAMTIIGLGLLAWLFRDSLMFWQTSSQQRANQPWIDLQPEEIDQQRLATIPEASQPATPAESTASAGLPPAYFNRDWQSMDVDSLFVALRQAQQTLAQAKVDDHGTLTAVLDQAEQSHQQGNQEATKQKLLYGLQLAQELAAVAKYYGNN